MRKAFDFGHSMPADAIVATSLENVYYLSDAFILTQRLIPKRLAFVLWPKEGKPVLGVCTIEESLARAESHIEDIRGYTEFQTSPMALLSSVIKEKSLQGVRIGIETGHLPSGYFEELKRELSAVTWVACDTYLERVRMVKTTGEVELMRKAARSTDDAIWHSFINANEGETELTVSARMQEFILSRSAQAIAFCVLGTGERAAMAHPLPTLRTMRKGDLIRTDFGGTFEGYYSDLARTGVVSRASSHQRETYARIWNVQRELIDSIRPNILAQDIYRRCRDLFVKNGLDFNMPHVGHSLGVGLHEYPMLADGVEQPLLPGMTLAIEPMHFEPDGQRFHIEDLVLVTERGHELLTDLSRWETVPETGGPKDRRDYLQVKGK